MRTLNDAGIVTRRAIEVVNWSDEEGARFEPANTASGAFAGQFSRQYMHNRVDRDGLRCKDELQRIGYLGEEANRPGPAAAYLELHIEQGPALEAAQLPVGVVEGVVGMTWSRVTVTGHANHVGTTPMVLRKDALAAAAGIIAGVERLGRETSGAVATVGRITAEPNLNGVIPGRVICNVDFCHRGGDARRAGGRVAWAGGGNSRRAGSGRVGRAVLDERASAVRAGGHRHRGGGVR